VHTAQCILITSDESPTNGGRYWIRPRDCCRTVIYQITCRAVCGGNDSLTGVFVATFLRVTNDVQKWVLPTTNRTILFLCDKSYSDSVCVPVPPCTMYTRFTMNRKTLMVFTLLSSACGTNRSNRTVNVYG